MQEAPVLRSRLCVDVATVSETAASRVSDTSPTSVGTAPVAVAFDSAGELARLLAVVDEALDGLVTSPLRRKAASEQPPRGRDGAASISAARCSSWEARAGVTARKRTRRSLSSCSVDG